jgi:eukaryotic-like serine/threonine-protein kinase
MVAIRSRRSMHQSLALLVALAALLACSLPPTAQAASPTLALSPSVGPPTTVATASGSGFASAEQIALGFDDRVVERFTALADGTFTESFTVPALAIPGNHTVSAKGASSGTATATFLVRTDWPTARFDPGGTGFNRYENVISPSNVGSLQVAWSVKTAGPLFRTPIVVGGKVYVVGQVGSTSEGAVYAFDATTGARLWKQTGSGEPPFEPAVADGRLFVGFLFGHTLRAYDATTGTLLWSANGPNLSPTVVGGVVYAADDLDSLWALDAATGHKLWVTHVPFGGYGFGLAVADGVVYVGGNDVNGTAPVYAYDAATGALLWRTPTGGRVIATPAVARGMVFVGSSDNSHVFYALDARTGRIRWTATTGGGIDASAAVGKGVVYFGSADHNLYAYATATGQQLWAAPTGESITASQSVALANGVVYVSSDSTAYAFDAATGQQLWSFQAGSGAHSPSIVNGTMYVASDDARLYAFRPV